jgi:fructose-bisphosphate aldolase class II
MKSFAMDTNRAIPILDKAQKEGYGIPAMCCYNTEGILATVRAAEAKNSPAMILLFPWAIQYANSCLVHLAAEAAK